MHACALALTDPTLTLFLKFEVVLGDANTRRDGKPPKVYKVRLNKVAEINPE